MPCPQCQHIREANIELQGDLSTAEANHAELRARAQRIASAALGLSQIAHMPLPDDIKTDISEVME